ncbi:DUF1275 domain-containing protein [Lactobacillus sp. S2-2]|uniref:YoaK family protein n=1 Tax=Lactobacillus sp. S2-2 TaxID=2692917 RepID=UPI001F43D746|nr:YoaK family protein [Lactobacillus sp. S2-2]MCF6515711.1 DUF1275 domain-containing protein [Lactobacillus sp. S2-2]
MDENKFTFPLIASLLAINAGFIDAYTFLFHGEVFAGLQTGNIILLGINLAQFNLINCLHYLISISMFIIGLLIIKFLQGITLDNLYRKKIVILFEITFIVLAIILKNKVPELLIVGFFSIAASAQLQEFDLLRGKAFNPIMMTGNIKKISNGIYDVFVHKNKTKLIPLLDTLVVLFSFIIGAFLVTLLGNLFGNIVIIVPVLILFLILFILKR